MKDLSRLGRDLRRVLILDNSPASYVFHPDNAVSASRDQGRGPRLEKGVSPWGHLGLLLPGWAVSGPGALPFLPLSSLTCVCLPRTWSFGPFCLVCRGPESLLGIGAVVVFLGVNCDPLVGHRNNLVGPSWDFLKNE